MLKKLNDNMLVLALKNFRVGAWEFVGISMSQLKKKSDRTWKIKYQSAYWLGNCVLKWMEKKTELVHPFGPQFKRLCLNSIFAMITAQLELRQD